MIGPALTWGNPKLSILIGTAGSKASHYYHLLAEAAGGAERLEALLEGIRQGTEQPFQILNREGPGPIAVISNWRCIPEFAKEPDFLGRVQQELNLSDSQIASEYEMKFSAAVDSAVFGFESIMGAQIEAIGPFESRRRGYIRRRRSSRPRQRLFSRNRPRSRAQHHRQRPLLGLSDIPPSNGLS